MFMSGDFFPDSEMKGDCACAHSPSPPLSISPLEEHRIYATRVDMNQMIRFGGNDRLCGSATAPSGHHYLLCTQLGCWGTIRRKRESSLQCR